LLEQTQHRASHTGWALWRYDKKTALEIILIAHYQQLVNPALIKNIEENYPMIYARSFSLLRESEVETLVRELKDHLLTQLWDDAANDISIFPKQYAGLN
jgi:hypothetical protein